MLIRNAVLIDGTRTDIRVGDTVTEVADDVTAAPGEDEFDAAGGTVLPGLNDHHLHLRAAAAALRSLRVGPDEVRDRAALAGVLAAAVPDQNGWIRAVGYHDSVAGPLTRDLLDAIAPEVPVRIQHRSGVQWTLNTAGLALVGKHDHPDGVLRSADPSWTLPATEPDLEGLGATLSRYGITGVTDATPDLGAGDITELQRRMPQTVRALAPGKRILHDDELDLDALTSWIRHTHSVGVPVALHCVTAAQLVVTLTALRSAGRHPLDRIEHAAVVPDGSVADLADSGVTVVTQPNFVAERGDQYLVDVPEHEHHELWRVGSLLEAGVPVALSTDAPFGHSDPWAAMRAAVHRRTPSGTVLGPNERITEATALAMFTGNRAGHPGAVVPGAPGDLCILATPPPQALAELDAAAVAATVIAGRVVYER
ncbi:MULTISPECIES: amidohydrolase family protein [Mycolicibacterium]|uniref:Predicted TIM-barrel fold metal-dependent hydrolase n=2 Tax=Mycolicibacterium gilvum TaxID=1804 RepID=E6TKS5_MYCSR|nr:MULTISPECIES: amidohydrolase family protein [Mycolicibacterium]ABP42937.1 Amidohydrolase 3 [Mycolicibacterium gilvum PYR-GCK]ADT97025.1 predicted TIM-barrel fold metal-dependent hydrolase [Mycolicibacterium gilvum Spyr1]MBV5244796.1 amidohydrolase family protein [Mycolicibacterium sp. PAM1]